jgi:predicted nucleic-acid-binding Zn-ribbon protein
MNLEEKYVKHILKPSTATKLPEIRSRIAGLPVCPRCERPALRDTRKGDPRMFDIDNPGVRYITCPICGYHGPYTHTIRDHMKRYVSPYSRGR